ncbi:MAG: diadenylate cyclase [bacterium]
MIINLVKNLTWLDIIDILLISFLAYQLYNLFYKTKAFRILLGLLGLAIIYIGARTWGLFLSTWTFQIFWQALIILIIIIFQPEIREVLEKINLFHYFQGTKTLSEEPLDLKTICKTVFQMGENRIGGIIILKRDDEVNKLIQDSIPFKGAISEPILLSIFQKHSPIHDGAILIEGGVIKSVAGFLPMTEKHNLPKKYGSRHRASLGLSEKSDALIIVTSEERGEVSLVLDGQITKIKDAFSLEKLINQHMMMQKGLEDKSIFIKKNPLRFLSEHWIAKIIIVILVFVFWALLAGQQNYTKDLIIPLNYTKIPHQLELVSPPVSTKITIKGLRRLVSAVTKEQIDIKLDVSLAQWGRRTYYITQENIDLPPGIELVYIDPSVLRLNFKDKNS